MLHDAAKRGDVEIPVFCYEPKLGDPVGACRMCLVEIEGIPKLQTSCSTPVRDGMVVHTRTDQVKHAQSAVVEFLLVNHPLDCPVCDKGGECPLQDISMGWGPGKSRMTDQKRHFEKPIELSPLVAIDRERCILCYRCVRFSQEVAEDEQLQLLERGDRTFVGTFDDRPYVDPFHGNITDLCPVGALTSYTYRFRARPWDIEQAGSVCTLCPSQCNVSFTVRDEQVKRVIARDNPDVDDGWLCDRGRYGFEMFAAEERVTGPRLRGGAGRAGRRRSRRRPRACGPPARASRGDRRRRLQRGGLPGPAHHARGARLAPRRVARRRRAEPRRRWCAWPSPSSRPASATSTTPTRSSSSAPTPCTARRSSTCGSARRCAATAPSWRSPPTARRRSTAAPQAVARYAPGDATPSSPSWPSLRRRPTTALLAVADVLRDAERVVVIWGERIGREGEAALTALLDLAAALDLAGKEGSGLLEVPDLTNARGLREAGCLPDAGPGLAETRFTLSPSQGPNVALVGKATEEIRAALESGELKSLILFGVDPLRDFPDTAAWDRALTAADHLIVFSTFETATTAKADVVFPLETHAEKDGTVTHPDGRLQRVRPSASRPGDIRPNWGVLAELALALGHDTGDHLPALGLRSSRPTRSPSTPASTTRRSAAAASAGRTATRLPSSRGPAGDDSRQARLRGGVSWATAHPRRRPARAPDALVLGTYRDLWAGPITELNPPLRFLEPQQTVELSLADAERLGLKSGDEVSVAQNGTSVRARVAIKERVAGRRLLPDRGHRRGQRERPAQRRPGLRSRSRRSSA